MTAARWRLLSRFLLQGLLLWLPLSAVAAQGVPPAAGSAQRIVRQGIAIELHIEPVGPGNRARDRLREDDTVTFRFRITDSHTSTPLSGVFPAAWMDRRPAGEPADAKTCRDKVEAFVGGSLFAQPELDLNTYYVLALNDDATISVVDPLFGFGTTKLLAMLFLDSPGEDWALTDDQSTLFVSLPEAGKVAVADTATWKVTHSLAIGQRPSRLALQGDEKYLWVAQDESAGKPSGVNVLDTEKLGAFQEILTGKGPHEIAFSGDDRYAFVTNRADGTLSVIDIGRLQKIRDIPTGKEPVSVAYSERADAVYVVNRGDGTIVAVDAKSHRIVARIQAEEGLGPIRFAPGGQLGFVVHPQRNLVHILDAATNRIHQTADVEAGPDQVTFSDHLAYIRHSGSETVLMIPLDKLGQQGAPVPLVDFPGGQSPFGRGSRPSPADGIVQAPGATGVLVANPADRAIYFYKEGMAAPMGHFQNYGRQPRAVLAVDRSLRERTPGNYQTTATLRGAGRYDVAFFLDSPRTIHCFEVEIGPNPQLEAERERQKSVEVQAFVGQRRLESGESVELEVGKTVPLRFQLIDPLSKKPRVGLSDVRVLTFRAPGQGQRRLPARQVEPGLYEIDFLPTHAAVYYAFVECPSAGLSFSQSRQLILVAKQGHTARGSGDP